ncbi:uncharacterized protein UV8b_00145 [Ustilaginoidea virens]|uniref:Uncharacterized protein n=1 Tax=Ustilaginoidea virens TaxID=1159556 RepID=A0A8E5HI79_USTVR|nr:uncharacterized protein UV8b_00145 [Ustilaginoidea virens]QUC15904.1 hypothetical protein UV8b_00145 [Ustilaginoidea virens]
MDGLSLSEENRARLKILGYIHAVEPVSHTQTHKNQGREEIQSQIDIRKAVSKLATLSPEQSRHDAILEVLGDLLRQSQEMQSELGQTVIGSPLPGFLESDESGARQCLVEAITSVALQSQQTEGLIAEAGLASLLLLLRLSRVPLLSNDDLINIISYTDKRNSWTTGSAAGLAQKILASHISRNDITDFTTGPVLRDFVPKQLSSLHSCGPPPVRDIDASPPESQDIVKGHDRLGPVLKWAIENSEEAYVARHWHLFIPALVALAGNCRGSFKIMGLEAIILFINKCPATTIYATGVDRVLESVIMPMLLLVPPLIPEEESVVVLNLGYQAILSLATKNADIHCCSRRRLLDTVVRDGILASHLHALERTSTLKALLDNTAKVVVCLNVFSVKHLTDFLEVVDTVMCDPFSAEDPSVLVSASEALAALLLNCWPRIKKTAREEQIIRMLCICWMNLKDYTSRQSLSFSSESNSRAAELSLIKTASMMCSVKKGSGALTDTRLRAVIDREPRLGSLFL